jgi:hypothetical protein
MVIESATDLFEVLDQFDPNSSMHLKALEVLVDEYPHFHLIQPYLLKAIQQQKHEKFDKTLSLAAISTFDRSLLYSFLENEEPSPSQNTKEIKVPKEEVETQETKTKETASPTTMRFSEWAYFLQSQKHEEKNKNLEEKFQLIDAFLSKEPSRFSPKIDDKNKEDLSELSWASTDELMTETLAKVFIKQKKYDKALQAYQILRLKYPEKNSFFADQIKTIKRLEKKKD